MEDRRKGAHFGIYTGRDQIAWLEKTSVVLLKKKTKLIEVLFSTDIFLVDLLG